MKSRSEIDWNKVRCDDVGGNYIESSGFCSIPDNKLDKILAISVWGYSVKRLEYDESGNKIWIPRLSFGSNSAWAFVSKKNNILIRVNVPSSTFDKWSDKYPRAIKKMELDYIDSMERPAKIAIHYREKKLDNWNKKWALEPEESGEEL